MSSVTTSQRITGAIVGETYRLECEIGRGGMGSVWRASHLRLPDKLVAIKILEENYANDTEVLARFRREAEIAARLHHPNIVNIHDYNTLSDGTPYFILELLEGESLEDRIAQGPMAEDELIRIVSEVCAGLRVAHERGVIHRDLKPQNVFLTSGVNGEVTKLLDFGISKIRGSDTVKTQTQTVLGTPQYMSPEQATGKHEAVNARTDIFCLGIMMFEMLSGKPPFTGHNIPEIVFKIVYEPEPNLDELCPQASKGVRDAIHKALAKKPDDRFASIEELLAALGVPVEAQSTGVKLAQPLRRKRSSISIEMAATVDSAAGRRSGLKLETGAPDSHLDAHARMRLPPAIIAALAIIAGGAIGVTKLATSDDEPAVAQVGTQAPAADRARAKAKPATEGAQRPAGSTTPEATAAEPRAAASDAPAPAKLAPVKPMPAPAKPAPAKDNIADDPIPPAPAKPAPTKTSGADDAIPTPAKTVATPAPRPTSVKPNLDERSTDGPSEAAIPKRVKPPLPSDAQIRRLPQAARDKLLLARDALRKNDTANAVRLAEGSFRDGGGDAASALEAVARCRRREQKRSGPVIRRIRNAAVARQLWQYCAEQRR